jgi:hypothetical protein
VSRRLQASRASGERSEIWQSDKKQTGRYDGKMRDGKKNGHGVNTWADGSRYNGDGATVRRTANVFGTISRCNHYVIATCYHQNYAHITPVVWMTNKNIHPINPQNEKY